MLNPIEAEALEVIEQLMAAFSIGRIKRGHYYELLGHLRDIAVKLRNKQYGCMTGRHSGTCSCKS